MSKVAVTLFTYETGNFLQSVNLNYSLMLYKQEKLKSPDNNTKNVCDVYIWCYAQQNQMLELFDLCTFILRSGASPEWSTP